MVTKSAEIVKLLSEGKTSGEIIEMGYKKGTVYAAQSKWHQGKVKTHNGGTDNAQTATVLTTQTTITMADIESDPEIVRLKKEIRKAELERELGRAKMPSRWAALPISA